MVLKILDTLMCNGRVELNHCWVQLSPLLTLPLYILHSLSILFTLYSFPLPPLYSPFLHPLYTLSLTHLYPLPTFPQMTSPPLTLPLYPFLHSFLNPSLPSTYISSYDYSPFDTPTLYSLSILLIYSPTIKNCCDHAAQLPLGFPLVTPAPAHMNSLPLTLLL